METFSRIDAVPHTWLAMQLMLKDLGALVIRRWLWLSFKV